METTTKHAWQQLPPIVSPSPVFALAAGQGEIWTGGVGGIASYPATDTSAVWQSRIARLPLSSVTALLYQDGLLLAGGIEGIACSWDGGINWQSAQLEEGMASITAFAASPQFNTDQTVVAATLANGILRSADGGRTWSNATFGLESFEVNTLAWGPGSTLLAGTIDGLYRSPNAGRAWRRLSIDEEASVEAIAFLPDGAFLATLEAGGLLRSDAGGVHWYVDNSVGQDIHAISLLVTAQQTLLMSTIEQGLLRSTDGGASWHPTYAHIVLSLAAEQNTLYAGSDNGVSVSDDDGLTWRELGCPPIHDLRQLFLYKQQPLVTGAYAGIMCYTSEQTWSSIADLPQPLTAVAILPDDTLLLSSPTGLLHVADDGKTQQTVMQGQTGQVARITVRQDGATWRIWAGSADGTRLLRSDDNGTTWQALPAPFGVLPLAALHATAERLIAATYDPRQYRVCIWSSTDNGETWERAMEAETKWPIVATYQHSMSGGFAIGDMLFLQRIGGQWSRSNVGSEAGAVRRIISAQQHGKTVLLALTTTGIQRSEDEGATWQHDDEGLPVEQIMDIATTDTTLSILLTAGRVWQCAL